MCDNFCMEDAPMSGVGNLWRGGPFFLAVCAAVLLFVFPQVCSAASSQLVWGNVTYDNDTGEIVSSDRIYMENGGTYPVALHTSKDVYVAYDGPGFSFSGVLFRVPDPQSPTRLFHPTPTLQEPKLHRMPTPS